MAVWKYQPPLGKPVVPLLKAKHESRQDTVENARLAFASYWGREWGRALCDKAYWTHLKAKHSRLRLKPSDAAAARTYKEVFYKFAFEKEGVQYAILVCRTRSSGGDTGRDNPLHLSFMKKTAGKWVLTMDLVNDPFTKSFAVPLQACHRPGGSVQSALKAIDAWARKLDKSQD